MAATSAELEGRAAAGAARDAIPGVTGASRASESIASQAGRVGSELDSVKVPESAPPGAAPGETAPPGRPPVDTAPSAADAPGGRAPVEIPRTVEPPRTETPGPSAPDSFSASESHAVEQPSPPASDPMPPVAPHGTAPTPAHADAPPPPSRGVEPAQIAESDPARPPPDGGGGHASAPAAGDASRPLTDSGSGGYGTDVAPAAGADDKVPASVRAHSGGSGEGAAGGSGHGSGGGEGGSSHGGSGHGSSGTGGGSGGSGHGSGRDSAEGSGHERHDSSGSSGDDHGGHDGSGDDSGGANGDESQRVETANSLNNAFKNGEATTDLARDVAEGSTHYIGDADRVVLGKWDGQDGGYIGEARHNGGIYFDTGDPVWEAVERGLDPDQAKILGWQVNEQFLRMQLEDGVPRIEYVLDSKYPTLEDVVLERQGSFSAMEIEYLTEHAAAYGYHRVGNSWMKDE